MTEQKTIPMIVIMGPTASGKSSLALQLADLFPSEIISADSMQVYRELDIGTAKPSVEDRTKVKHHLIDILDISERQDVFSWVALAEKAIRSIQASGKIPIIAGGTGMYIRALLYGLDPLPSDRNIAQRLYDEHQKNPESLKEQLLRKDPEAYSLYMNQPKKIIRALEVIEITGNSILKQRTAWEKNRLRYNARAFRLSIERKDLFRRIEQRTDEMLRHGWIEEARKLISKGLLNAPTAWQVIGYAQIGEYLKGNISFEEMRTLIISTTKKYARRQDTWFKHQHPEAEELTAPADAATLIGKIKNISHFHS